MTDVLRTSQRSSSIGALSPAGAGEAVRLVGWVHRNRDLGSLVFCDLRDRSGRVQVSFDPDWSPSPVLERARGLGPEDVVEVEGTLEERPVEDRRDDREAGRIEVRATGLRILAEAEPLPIPVYRTPDEELPAEERRLRYRHLDLRRPELQRNLRLRHDAARAVRGFLSERGFLEIDTPLLTKRTPEGARDYLVPSRVHPGEFYALPQSPQLYKQLLMVAGLDRYFQIARCLRDEDLRADRQPEFTQVDLEMSFAGVEDVLEVTEGMVGRLWEEVLGRSLAGPFRRLPYDEALARYGSDKPDLRYELPVHELTELLREADFRVFQGTRGSDRRIRGLRAPGGARLSRRELDEVQEVARQGGAPGALWVKRTADGYSGPFARGLVGGVGDRLAADLSLAEGDLVVVVVGSFASGGAAPVAGEAALEPALDLLRRELARRLEPEGAQDAWVWITDFPLLLPAPETGGYEPAHHPFTMPHPDDLPLLAEAVGEGTGLPPGSLPRSPRSLAYDAVYNGSEIASGSVRIHDPAVQRLVFRALGLDDEEVAGRFGFLLDSFRHGAPPHAGIALGFDRLVMLMAGAGSLREVIAFPKTTAARALLEGAPSAVGEEELGPLGIALRSPVPAGDASRDPQDDG